MQFKKGKEKKIVKIKMKNKKACATALMKSCNVKIFPFKYAL
jgi:hypothetical protein